MGHFPVSYTPTAMQNAGDTHDTEDNTVLPEPDGTTGASLLHVVPFQICAVGFAWP